MVTVKFRQLPVVENGEVVALLNITKCLYNATVFKVDSTKPIMHKHLQCVEAVCHRVELPQLRCVGVTHIPGDLDVMFPLRAAISCGQPPWISFRRQCRSSTLSSCSELVHRYSGINKFIFQFLVKTFMFISNSLKVYDIFSIRDKFPFISCTSWDASRSAASCTVYVVFSRVFVETVVKVANNFSNAPRSTWRRS